MTATTALRRLARADRLAQLGIFVEIVVVIRVIAEVMRLKASDPAFDLDTASVWLAGALAALGFLLVSVILYFAGRERLAGLAALVMVPVLVAFKAAYLGLG